MSALEDSDSDISDSSSDTNPVEPLYGLQLESDFFDRYMGEGEEIDDEDEVDRGSDLASIRSFTIHEHEPKRGHEYEEDHERAHSQKHTRHYVQNATSVTLSSTAGDPKDYRIRLAVAPVEFDIRDFSDNHIRSLVLKGVAHLVSKGAFLPRGMTYNPPDPTLLGIPRELRDRIYHFCNCENTHGTTRGYSLVLRKTSEHEPRVKRRKLASGSSVDAPNNIPNIRIKSEGPIRFPELRLVSRKMHQELVEDYLGEATVGVKIDCTHLPDERPIADISDRVFPMWLMRHVLRLNIEIRCSIEQWRRVQGLLCIRLRLMSLKGKITLRIFITYPEAEEKRSLDLLPQGWCESEKGKLAQIWFRGHSKKIEDEFVALKQCPSVQQIQVLQLNRTPKLAITALYSRWAAQRVIVMNKTRGDWKTSEPDTYIGFDHQYIVVDHSGIQDL